MVEYSLDFDLIFQALSDKTRRDLLTWVLRSDQTISQLANRYQLTFAGVAKHIDVLFKSRLVLKRRQGREQIVSANRHAVEETTALLNSYQQLWTERLERLDAFLESEEN